MFQRVRPPILAFILGTILLLVALVLGPSLTLPAAAARAPAVGAPASQVQILTDADATVDSLAPSSNYGAALRIKAGHGSAREGDQRALLHFELSGSVPANAIIDSAQLHVFLVDYSGVEAVSLTTYLVTAPWQEGAVTWNSQPTTSSAGETRNVLPVKGEQSWDVTGLAQNWQVGRNFGLLLRGPEATSAAYTRGFLSRENSESVPHLVVTYHLPTTPTPTPPPTATPTPPPVDDTPPTNPTVTANRATGTWSNQPAILMSWTGASDGWGSGVHGYSYQWAEAAGALPDAIEDTTRTSGLTSLPADGKSWYFAVRTVDNAGNWARGAAELGPFWLDTVPPTNPAALTDPAPGAWSRDNTIGATWDNGTDNPGGSGVLGYSTLFSQSVKDRPDDIMDTDWNTDGSGIVADGKWYFHLITGDHAGNWSTLKIDVGPILIDTVSPSSYVGQGDHTVVEVGTNDFVVRVTGSDAGSGVKTITVQYDDTTVKTGWLTWKTDAQPDGAYPFSGAPGHTYCFRTQATDNAGNVELWPGQADRCVIVATADIIVDKVVLTQGIQNYQGDQFLIAGRRTFARCFVRSEAGTFTGVDARLLVWDNNGVKRGDLKPLNQPDGRITVKPSPDRGVLGDSFYFEIPVDWVTTAGGTYRCYVNMEQKYHEKSTDNNVAGLTTNAVPPPPIMDLLVVDVPYVANGVVQLPTWNDYFMLESYLKRTYPITGLTIASTALDPPYGSLPSAAKVNAALRYNKVMSLFTGGGEPFFRRHYGMAADSGGFMRGLGDQPGLVASGPTGPGAWGWDFDGSYGDWYGAHELGHNYGRLHVLCAGDEADPDPGFPHPGGRISTATDPADPATWYGFDFEGPKLMGPTSADLMTYCGNLWMSSYTYKAIYNNMRGEVTGQAAAFAAAAAAAPAEHILVQAEVSASDAITMTAFMRIPNSFDALGRAPGDYSVRLLGSGGAILVDIPFAVHFDRPDQPSSFGVMAPWIDGVKQVAIYHGSKLLASRAVSAHAPSVTLLSPNGREQLSGDSFEVRWQAGDADGDVLTFTLDYSIDGGAHWRGLAFGLMGTQARLSLPRLPGSNQARLRVWASDGVNTASDEADASFSVPLKPPVAGILSPRTGTRVAYGQLITFEASAMDPEDGGLAAGMLRWSSDLDGVLGSGSLLQTSTLVTGTHTITLTATDSAGQSATAVTTVWVGVQPTFLPLLMR